MVYRIDTDSQETLADIIKKLNTTKAGFQLYWYAFDYYAHDAYDKPLQSEGYFIDLDESQYDLAAMADILTDYMLTIKAGWTKNRDLFGTASIEDDEYFDAVTLYVTKRKVE